MEVEHTFEEYCQQIRLYKELADSIPLAKEHVITMGMYDMHREELIKSLVLNAEKFMEALIMHCVKDYQNLCKGYVVISHNIIHLKKELK